MRLLFLLSIMLWSSHQILAQNEEIILGQNATKISAALFDLSDPLGVNMEINLWGSVRHPGRYRVPITTTFLDLLSYAGGPLESSNLEDIRIYRQPKDTLTGKTTVLRLDYGDLLFEENVRSNKLQNISLQAGDVIVLREEKRYTFRENVSFFLPIVSSVIGLVTLIVTLTSK